MRQLRRFVGPACALTLIAVGMAACGDDTKLPQAPAATPFRASTVTVQQQGNADVTIDPASVTYQLDDSRSLVVRLVVRSNAAATIAIIIRGSIYDPSHALVGDVTGGQINVTPGSTANVQLNGPTPLGTIASTTFEVSATPTPT